MSAPPARPGGRRRLVAAAVLLVTVAAGAVAWKSRPPVHRPDIVVILWDTARPDRMSTFGHDRPTTPFLDSVAATGVVYERCMTPSPWTPPAHASLFTGLLPRRHGLRSTPGRVLASVPVLAETLSGAGYETVGVTCNPMVSGMNGLDRGFGTFLRVFGDAEPKSTGERALAALQAWDAGRPPGRRPLFLFVNLMETHLPRSPDEGDLRAVLGDERAASPDIATALRFNPLDALAFTMGFRPLDAAALRGVSDVYDASVRSVDDVTAAMVAWLETRGLSDDALLVVTSDHGENLGEHGQMDHIVSSYDTLLHIPLVLRRKGEFEGGRREPRQVLLQDLHPTILETAGVPTPAGTGLDARSLRDIPEGGRTLLADYRPPATVARSMPAMFPNAPEKAFTPFLVTIVAAADPPSRPGARKYLGYFWEDDLDQPPLREELYDIVTDPAETRDLLSENPDATARADAERLRKLALESRR